MFEKRKNLLEQNFDDEINNNKQIVVNVTPVQQPDYFPFYDAGYL